MNTQDYIIGCFEAAIAEGLHEAIAETADERLKDLLERRVMHAYYAAKGLGPILTQEPVAKTGKAYVDSLIDALLLPPPAMSASDLKALHRRCAEMLHLQATVAPQAAAPSQAQGAMPDCWVVVKNGKILGTHDEPCQNQGIQGVRYVPASESQAAAPQPQGEVKLPTSAEEAEAMQKVGYAYLKAHAPHRLTSAALQPDGQKPVAHATVEPLRPDESQRRVTVKWVGQPVAGPLYAAADAVAEQGQGWQPIQTAPKDSSRGKIEVWPATSKVLAVYWDSICGEWRHLDYSGNLYAIKNATYRRPMPTPPNTMPTPQPMPDLTTLITNGAKAWAGVNAQDLREGKPVGEPPAEALGESQPKPLGWYCVSADGEATLCVDAKNASDVAEDANYESPRQGPHKAMQLCEYQDTAPADQLPDAGKLVAALQPLTDEQIRAAVSGAGLQFTAPDLRVGRAVIAEFCRVNGIGAKPEPKSRASDCIVCANADSFGLPDKPFCNACFANSHWQPLNKSSVNPNAKRAKP